MWTVRNAGDRPVGPLSYRGVGVLLSPEVESWFAQKQPPAEQTMRRVLDVLLSADPRLTAYIKYGSLIVGFEGDLAAFVQSSKKQVNLMFGRGARIKGDFPHLEGTGPSARFMRFADVAEVDARAKELAPVATAWCALVEPKPG
jgi:Domain of unknown function (DU1801)